MSTTLSMATKLSGDEKGLWPSELHEYAQRMSYTKPIYNFEEDNTLSQLTPFTCSVEIGGIKYVGDAARSKKKAKNQAARTALLAIRANKEKICDVVENNSVLTLLPFQKRAAEPQSYTEEASESSQVNKRLRKLEPYIDHDVGNMGTQVLPISKKNSNSTLAKIKPEIEPSTRMDGLNQCTQTGIQAGNSNPYVFKSRLSEYTQKVGLPIPAYRTLKEGPSHQPSFRSSVTVNSIRYESLPGFFNRKASEQSAAEVALLELEKSGELGQSVSEPVHETGLCKSKLQEFAQKLNYPIPLYKCQRDEGPGEANRFTCSVEIGGVKYTGDAARSIKKAQIKAAGKALLAIQLMNAQLADPVNLSVETREIPNGAESVSNQTTLDAGQCSNTRVGTFSVIKIEN